MSPHPTAGPVDVHAVALWPGAGTSADHPSLVAIEQGLAPLHVERFDFPYRREGRRAPDRANKLIASLRADVADLCARLGTTPDHVVLGGRSMGGRMCSMAVAGATGATAKGAETHEDPLPAAGLVLLGYPLHPPGKPERLRIEHLPDVAVPTLFVSGDRDAFGTQDELAEARGLVAGPVTSVTIPGARHELKGIDDQLVAAIREWLGV
jgi:predicted alpha/beta-hydrolase family hydrolase